MQLSRSSDAWGEKVWEFILSLVSIGEDSIEIPVSERAVSSLWRSLCSDPCGAPFGHRVAQLNPYL
jgi:hypothetical protein